MPIKRKFLIALIFISAIFFGSFQEKVKISVNNIIRYSDYVPNYDQLSPQERNKQVTTIVNSLPRDFYTSQSVMPWFYSLGLSQMKALKWVNTVVFVTIHLLLNALILILLFKDKQMIQTLVLFYVGLFILGYVILVVGKLVGFSQSGYNVARKIVGALQSQIPLMFFIIGYYFNKQTIK